jgi:predicted Na+-dependent transporter
VNISIIWSKRWKYISASCGLLALVFNALASISSFLEAKYETSYLSVISGILNILAICFGTIMAYATKRRRERISMVNYYIHKLNIPLELYQVSEVDKQTSN